jgi:plastocyanin
MLAVLSMCRAGCAQNADVDARVKILRVGTDATKADDSNVVVWLKPASGSTQLNPPESKHYTVTQKDKQFIPHVLAVPVGTKVEFPNKDPFFHNVFSLYQGKRFDLGLYEAGSSREVLFNKPGVSFIFCNIHPNMSAYVLALETPHFGTSDKNGRIAIHGVPWGRYRLEVWHERAESGELAKLSKIVEVGGPATSLGTIEVRESARFQPEHLNKQGKPYDPELPPY